MHKKQSEEEMKNMFKIRYRYFVQKARDRGYVSCPHCHSLIKQCPFCKEDMLLPKAFTLPDYVVSPDFHYVECKQGRESWNILDFTPVQIKVMNAHVKTGGEGYLFLLLGDGTAPKGRGAWLVEWETWLNIQHNLLEAGCKSLRFEETERSRMPTASGALMGWELEWQTGGWAIPEHHPYWSRKAGRGKVNNESAREDRFQ